MRVTIRPYRNSARRRVLDATGNPRHIARRLFAVRFVELRSSVNIDRNHNRYLVVVHDFRRNDESRQKNADFSPTTEAGTQFLPSPTTGWTWCVPPPWEPWPGPPAHMLIVHGAGPPGLLPAKRRIVRGYSDTDADRPRSSSMPAIRHRFLFAIACILTFVGCPNTPTS